MLPPFTELVTGVRLFGIIFLIYLGICRGQETFENRFCCFKTLTCTHMLRGPCSDLTSLLHPR